MCMCDMSVRYFGFQTIHGIFLCIKLLTNRYQLGVFVGDNLLQHLDLLLKLGHIRPPTFGHASNILLDEKRDVSKTQFGVRAMKVL